MRHWKSDSGRLAARLILLWPLAVALIATATQAANTSEPYVTCHLAEDGVTDDGLAVNACLAAHPGRHIMLRKAGGASYGGGQATSKDIYSSQTLTLVGDAQWLDCDAPALWAGGAALISAHPERAGHRGSAYSLRSRDFELGSLRRQLLESY